MGNTVPGVGMVGIGGYAQVHLRVLRTLHHAGLCRLAAVADPTAGHLPEVCAGLRAEGVEIYDTDRALLERGDIDAVVIATPIWLHARQAVAALQAGKHVYLEKPPCVTLPEFDEIEAAWRASGRVCAVGFQREASPATRYIRSVVAAGTLGTLTDVWTSVRWSRDTAYYDRAVWAGRMSLDGRTVFDGPATNALAHAVQAALSLAGEPVRVRGRFMRARPIESYDTSYMEAECASGAVVKLAFTHATETHEEVRLHLRGTSGEASFGWSGEVTVTAGGRTNSARLPYEEAVAILLDFLAAVKGGQGPATSLPQAKGFVAGVNAALQSGGGVGTLAPDLVEAVRRGSAGEDANDVYTVRGLDAQMEAFAADPALPPALLSPGPWVEWTPAWRPIHDGNNAPDEAACL